MEIKNFGYRLYIYKNEQYCFVKKKKSTCNLTTYEMSEQQKKTTTTTYIDKDTEKWLGKDER